MIPLPMQDRRLANGGLLAALVAAGAGCATMGLVYVGATASPTLNRMLTWYAPAGALSGMCGVTVLLWLLSWLGLHKGWSERNLDLRGPLTLAMGLLVLGVLLTFPPIARLL